MGREHVVAYESMDVKVVDGEADIVSIASPDNTHAKYAMEALKQGSHVFCEKPLATTAKDYHKLLRCTMKSDGVIWQHFPLRYQKIFVDLKENLDKYGDIYRIEASYNWGRTDKLFESWRYRDPDYSLVMGGMIHMIDLVGWLLEDQEIEPRYAVGVNKSAPGYEHPDTVTALCEIETGGICVFTVDGGKGVEHHNHRLTIHGNKKGWTGVNRLPTDKRAAIIDFVKEIRDGDPEHNGLYATFVALKIDEAIREYLEEWE